jgi:hypothetical protein
MTLSERLRLIESKQHLPANVIRLDERRERRQTPRWLEWTQENEKRGKDYTGYIGGGDAA